MAGRSKFTEFLQERRRKNECTEKHNQSTARNFLYLANFWHCIHNVPFYPFEEQIIETAVGMKANSHLYISSPTLQYLNMSPTTQQQTTVKRVCKYMLV